MNSKSSNYDKAFFIRLGVLGFLLVVVGGSFAYDRLVLLPAGDKAVERIVNAGLEISATKDSIHKAAGREPNESKMLGSHEIEDYNFGRILPNLEGRKVSVVYLDGKVTETYRGGISDADRQTYN